MTQGSSVSAKKQKPQPSWQVSLGSLNERWMYALNNKICTDMTFKCGESEELIPAHRILLILHSPVFETMLSNRWTNVDNKEEHETLVISVPEEDPTTFRHFLNTLYTAKVSENLAVDQRLGMLQISKKYLCNDVTQKIVASLKSVFEETNAIKIYETAQLCDEVELERAAEEYILSNASAMVRLKQFPLFTREENLKHFLLHDDLNVDELMLFHAVLQWGEVQLEKESYEETPPEPKNLAQVLEGVIKCVRYTQMTAEQFSTEVVPKKVLGLQETVDIFQYLTLPPEKRERKGTEEAIPTLIADNNSKDICVNKKRARKMFSYLFQRLKGHGYDFGRKWQHLCFQTDANISLVSLGLFKAVEKDKTLSISLRVQDYDMEQIFGEQETTIESWEGGDKDVVHVKFLPPVRINRDKWYTISYRIQGGETFYKTEGPAKITLDCGVDQKVTFVFKEAKFDSDLDQVPEICFRLL